MIPPPAPYRTDTGPRVLHTLRCAGFTPLAGVAVATGLSVPEAESALIDLAVAGWVSRAPGELGGGWGLTEDGRAEAARLVAGELAASGARPAVSGAYEDFLVLNPELLDLCTAWQLRPGDGAPTVNDHSDPVYDARVLGLFVELHERALPVCDRLAAALERFGRYRVRLGDALRRARSGEPDQLTDTTSSYHTVWFQLHEDLLTTLDLSRHG
ncbi:transcriptional regulator [Streptomyces sp. NPDC058953]|uniref:transcriptional regulator n=1 Tax=Streptomyces sp. NPDC058953 TaxID=3346676 RepID=UPI00369BB649